MGFRISFPENLWKFYYNLFLVWLFSIGCSKHRYFCWFMLNYLCQQNDSMKINLKILNWILIIWLAINDNGILGELIYIFGYRGVFIDLFNAVCLSLPLSFFLAIYTGRSCLLSGPFPFVSRCQSAEFYGINLIKRLPGSDIKCNPIHQNHNEITFQRPLPLAPHFIYLWLLQLATT